MAEIFTIIAPVFLIMMLGFGLGKTRLFPEGSSTILITFVWYVAIPALMFRGLAPKDLPAADELILVAAYYGSLYIIYFLAVFLSRYLFKLTSAETGTFALTACFANGGFVGIPILEGAYGAEGVRLLLVLISFHSLTLIPVTTLIVERGLKTDDGRSLFVRTVASTLNNPCSLCSLDWHGRQRHYRFRIGSTKCWSCQQPARRQPGCLLRGSRFQISKCRATLVTLFYL